MITENGLTSLVAEGEGEETPMAPGAPETPEEAPMEQPGGEGEETEEETTPGEPSAPAMVLDGEEEGGESSQEESSEL